MSVITLTPAAVKELKRVWEEQELPETAVLKVAVRGGGCSGFQWVLNIEEEYDPDKVVTEEHDGFKVVIDNRSALYVQGTTIDFHQDINKRGFVFNNPSVKNTCGCGSSFQM